MRILIDIGHPGQVHFFKHFAWLMYQKGHKILFIVREKDLSTYLLNYYGFNYISFGKHYKNILYKIFT